MRRVPDADTRALASSDRVPWEALLGARILVTGGTGFVGAWMAATLLEADERLGLGVELLLLTRSPRAVAARLPWMADEHRVTLFAGDVADCVWPAGPFTHVVAGAASADAAVNEGDPDATYRTIVGGTRRTLEEAGRRGAPRTLLLSSGAVYGSSHPGEPIPEDATIAASGGDSDSTYHAGKRAAEVVGLEAAAAGLPVTIARLFAFLGPYLPLDRHFAAGNFVADALHGGPVTVRGDGTPVRSYLYGRDMALWLWVILLAGRPGEAYNVGSERAVSIAEIAGLVAAAVNPAVDVEVLGSPSWPGGSPSGGAGGAWYVPLTKKAREELALEEWTGLEEGVDRMVAWYGGGEG